MQVTFIAHAGIFITEGDTEILVDPWFSDSTVKNPIIEAIYGYPTIDFQIPKTDDLPSNHVPDAILVSHFHAHHAPHDDIMSLVAQSEGKKKVTFGHPDLGEKNSDVAQAFQIWPHVTLAPMKNNGAFECGPLRVSAFSHTLPKHIAWRVTSETGSVLHIADPSFNRDRSRRSLDDAWLAFQDMRPDVLFINAGGNSVRWEKEGVRSITESAAVSPIEAAQIISIIKPRAVSLVGCYNHSVWKNRQEYIPPASQIEEEFCWALSWLVPDTKFVPVKPGHVFALGEQGGSFDTFIAPR